MSTTKQKARYAGFIYLLLVFTSIFSILYVPNTLTEFGDATATVSNMASSELLFRAGILAGLLSQIIFVFLVLALFRLFKEVDLRLAMLMVTLVVISAATGFLNSLNQIAALIIIDNDDFLSVFDKTQLDALAYFFVRLHSQGLQVIQIFWGLWLFPFGLLVYRSQFIPRILGVLLLIAGSAYVMGAVSFLVLPQFKAALSSLLLILELGELPIVFWLLFMGARTE